MSVISSVICNSLAIDLLDVETVSVRFREAIYCPTELFALPRVHTCKALYAYDSAAIVTFCV